MAATVLDPAADDHSTDLFICYNRAEPGIRDAIADAEEALTLSNRSYFYDMRSLDASQPWESALLVALTSTAIVAVIIGREGLGPTQTEEVIIARNARSRSRKANRAPTPAIAVIAIDDALPPQWLEGETRFCISLEDLSSTLDDIANQRRHSTSSQQRRLRKNPYLGFSSFTSAQTGFFFGRDADIARLLKVIAESKVTTIIGASGSGKTSLVQAGLLPRLCRSVPAASTEEPLIVSMTPMGDPVEQLATSLASSINKRSPDTGRFDTLRATFRGLLMDGGNALGTIVEQYVLGHNVAPSVILVVDQLEALLLDPRIARHGDVDARDTAEQHPARLTPLDPISSFGQLLAAAVDANDPITIIATLRADFLQMALRYPALSVLTAPLQVLGAPSSSQLRDIILRPLGDTAKCESGLVERIVNDASSQPGALPIVQVALSELWDRYVSRVQGGDRFDYLTHDDYEQIGGILGVIRGHANEVMQKLKGHDQQLARQLLVRMVAGQSHAGGGSTPSTRRWVSIESVRGVFSDLDSDAFDRVLRHLSGHRSDQKVRLLTIDTAGGQSFVTLSHDALIDHWQELARWVEADAESPYRHWLTVATEQWDSMGRSQDELLTGHRLTEANAWCDTNLSLLSDREREFMKASRDLHDKREHDALTERDRRARIGRRRVLVVVAVLVAAVVGFAAMYQRERVARDEAQNQTQAAHEANAATERQARLTAAATVLAEQHAADARASALAAASDSANDRDPRLAALLALEAARLESQGTGAATGRVWAALWQIAESAVIGTAEEVDFPVSQVRMSPDGSWLAGTGGRGGDFAMWNSDGTLLASPTNHRSWVQHFAFTPDGQSLLTVEGNGDLRSWSRDGRLLWWTKTPIDHVWRLVIDPTGRYYIGLASNEAFIGSLDGRTVTTLDLSLSDGSIPAAAFDATGRTIYIADDEGLTAWTTSGRPIEYLAGPIRRLAEDHGPIRRIAVSPDNRTILTVTSGTVRLWTRRGDLVADMTPGNASITEAHFSPDGTYLVTIDASGWVHIWTHEGGSVRQFRAHDAGARSLLIADDSSQFLTEGYDNSVYAWTRAGSLARVLRAPSAINGSSPSGPGLVTVSAIAGTVILWDTRIGGQVFDEPLENSSSDVVMSNNGKYVGVATGSGTVRVWNATGSLMAAVKHETPAGEELMGVEPEIRLQPNGHHFATYSSLTSNVMLWNGWGQLVRSMDHSGTIDDASFSPDGSRILSIVSEGRDVHLWGLGHTPDTTLSHTRRVASASFSPDGSRVVTVSGDTARVWQADGALPARDLNTRFPVASAAFLSNVEVIVVLAESGDTLELWSLQGVRLREIVLDGSRATEVVISPWSRGFLTRHSDGTIRAWSDHGVSRGQIDDSHAVKYEAVYGPGGDVILTSGYSTTDSVRVWSLAGELLAVLPGHLSWSAATTAVSDSRSQVVTSTGIGAHVARLWSFEQAYQQVLQKSQHWRLHQWECAAYALSCISDIDG